MTASIVARYAVFIAIAAGAICFGGLSLAQQAPSPYPPQMTDAHPQAIGGPVGTPTYVIAPPPAQPAQKGGFINIGQAFSPILEPYIDALVNALLAAAVGYLCLLYTKITGKQVEQHDRDAYTRMLQNEAGSLLADGKVKLEKTLDGVRIHVDSDALANAANRGLTKVADAQKNFGITPEAAAQRIVDMIPQIAAGAQLMAQAAVKPSAPQTALPAPKP